MHGDNLQSNRAYLETFGFIQAVEEASTAAVSVNSLKLVIFPSAIVET
jgi:hypothetical protein